MRSTTLPNPRTVLAAVMGLVLTVGCQHAINPFLDDLPATPEVTTASVEGARAAPTRPSIPRRDFSSVQVYPQDGTVDHWPLWWEDPFEDKGSDDGQLAWTEEDYFAYVYGSGRFLLNTMAFPISAWVTKPFTVLCSDGRLSRQKLGYDHDAIPCPGGTAPPIDLLEIGTYHEESPSGMTDDRAEVVTTERSADE
ncbi:MAG: hypothetical protein ACYSVY_02440 [Planctomycetota bacterium]